MNDLKRKTLRGGLAKVLVQAVGLPLRVGSLLVLARLLDPKDFGLVGMVTVVTGVFNLFRDAGLSLVTIQRPTISHEQLSTLFWLNILVGVILTLGMAAASPALALFYHEPRLFAVSMAMAAGFLINAAGVQHSALLQRSMRFTALAAIETTALVASIIAGVGLARLGAGYWALVAQALVLPAVSTLGFWFSHRWLPGRPQRGTGIRSMMGFGGTVTLNSLVVYAGYNADKLLLGRFGGAAILGIYGRAYQLINIPTENLNSAISGVALAALSRLHDDLDRFRSYFLKGYSMSLALTVPLTLVCAVFADDIIAVLLGPKWRDAAAIFRFLAPTILGFALINPLYWLLVPSGQVKRSLKMALVIAPTVTAGYVIGLPFGSKGVALGYSAALVLLTVPMIVWATRGLVVTWRDMLKAIVPPFVSAIVATSLGLAAGLFWCQSLVPLQRLVIEMVIVSAAYVLMLLYAMGEKAMYFELVRNLLGRSSPPPLASVPVGAS
jgi:PST family polysaccharide transporter